MFFIYEKHLLFMFPLEPASDCARPAGGIGRASGAVLSQDTIPKPDGLAWPVPGPSSNQNRTHLARCPALFESGPAIVRGRIELRSAVGFAAMADADDLDGGLVPVLEEKPVVAAAEAEAGLGRLELLHVAVACGKVSVGQVARS